MEQVEKEVLRWHHKQFPLPNITATENKFDEEISEFLEEYKYFKDTRKSNLDNMEEEFADMCIVLMSLQEQRGRRPLSVIIRDKLEINKKRKWKKDGSREKHIDSNSKIVLR